MKLQVTVLPGDGIGPEVTRQAVAVLQAVADVCGHDFQFESHRIGGIAIEQDGTPLPERTLSRMPGIRCGVARRGRRAQIR